MGASKVIVGKGFLRYVFVCVRAVIVNVNAAADCFGLSGHKRRRCCGYTACS